MAVPEAGGLRAERRQLELIHTEADRAYVRGTLFDGDLVIVAGVHRIVPGMPVRATRPGTAAPSSEPSGSPSASGRS